MELRHLSYFAACAETGSMSLAATRLAMTQPTLSRQVRNLEGELGAQLLRRSSRGVTTTAAGERLLRHYRRVAADIARIPEVMAAAAAERETVRVGIPPSLPTGWFADVMDDLREHYPHIDLDLVDLFTPEQERALTEGRLDVGILHHEAAGLVTRETLRQPLGVAVRPALAGDVHSLADMHGRRVLGHETWENSGQWRDLVAAAAAEGAAVDWRFRRFSEHVELVALAAGADGLLVTRDTAHRFVPSWPWVAISPGTLELTSWVAYPRGAGEASLAVAAAISARPYEQPPR